jgi:hypothetical protein
MPIEHFATGHLPRLQDYGRAWLGISGEFVVNSFKLTEVCTQGWLESVSKLGWIA